MYSVITAKETELNNNTQEDNKMAKYIEVNFTGITGADLDRKYRKYWLMGYGFVKYITNGKTTWMLLERGADYSDINF